MVQGHGRLPGWRRYVVGRNRQGVFTTLLAPWRLMLSRMAILSQAHRTAECGTMAWRVGVLQVVGEVGHGGDGLDVAGCDAAAVGAYGAAQERGVLVVLHDR